MTRESSDLDYANVLKRAASVLIQPKNALVLYLGGAMVLLGSLASGFLLAGPLGVGYADACSKLAHGGRADLDDVIWRGFERLGPAVVAGFILSAAVAAGMFMLILPGMMALLFAALTFTALARDQDGRGGLETLQRLGRFAVARPVPLVLMSLLPSLIGIAFALTGIGAVVTIALTFVVATFVHDHYFGLPA